MRKNYTRLTALATPLHMYTVHLSRYYVKDIRSYMYQVVIVYKYE